MKELNKSYYRCKEFEVLREEAIRQLNAFGYERKYNHVGMIISDPVRLARRVLSRANNVPEYLSTILGVSKPYYHDVETEVVDTRNAMYSYDVLRKALAVKVLANSMVIRTSSMGIRALPISDLY